MTREEAIKILNEIIDEGWLISDFDKCIAIDACKMAINALEKEPVYFPLCADCKTKINEIRKPHSMNAIRKAYNMEEIKKPYDKMKNRAFYGDAVSRKAVLKEIPVLWNSIGDKDYCMETLRDFVAELPTVTPTRKSGLHWIERFNNEDKWVECPHCHKDSDNAFDYCPNCGASFKEENEDIFNYMIKAMEQEPILDKIRAEIEQVAEEETKFDKKWAQGLKYSLKIIEKYKAESEE